MRVKGRSNSKGRLHGKGYVDVKAFEKNLLLLSRMKHWAWLIKHIVQVWYGDDKTARDMATFIFIFSYLTF